LIILDWMLPGMSGLEICRSLRGHDRTQHVPILMVTAKSSSVDCLTALEAGADDYVTKPFSPREVALRAGNVLRNRQQRTPEAFTVGAITLDASRHTVTVANRPVILARIEFNLLAMLMKHPGELRTRDELLNEVWGYDKTMITRTVDTHVRRLRRKLGKWGEAIKTVRTYGYRLDTL
jgi:DNA-binding response OmpR family regulator